MNVLTLTGNLGQDCRIGNVGGTAVVNFSVAMKSGYGDKAQTVWVDCALWGKQAESRLPEFLLKGQQVAVSGELSTREHDGKTYLQCRVNSIDLIGKRDDSAPATRQPAQPEPAPAAQSQMPDFEDDIPF
jgi:single-strand DNA-binding protein